MKRSGFAQDAAYSVFEGLRPEPGESLDRLALATYSLDLVAIAALLLSLSRAGEQELDAGPLSLVDALQELGPRLAIVYQTDRLRAADRTYGILHLLDQRLFPVTPPRGASYHPKLALSRYTSGKGAHWRLWIGSRNLTGGQDREAGVLLHGTSRGLRGSKCVAVADMLGELLTPVPWIAAALDELATLRWTAPEGVRLRSVQWRRAGIDRPFATALPRADTVLAISPFVDLSEMRSLAKTAGAQLVTTELVAKALGARALDVRATRAPLLSPAMAADPDESGEGEGPPPCDPPGLHAKLILKCRSRTARLWIGSANLTRRGMQGPNAEVMAELDIPPQTAADLIDFAAMHGPLGDRHVVLPPAEQQAAERALDQAIMTVLEADFVLSRREDGLHIATATSLAAFLADHRLNCWLLTRPDAIAAWRQDTRSLLLVPGGVPLKQETVLVVFSAERVDNLCLPRRWAQAARFPEHSTEARDRAAFAGYIGAAGASAWLRAQLEGIPPVESSSWNGVKSPVALGEKGGSEPVPLALEEVLGAWARNPADFEQRSRALAPTLQALGAELRGTMIDDTDAAALAEWKRVEQFWGVVQAAIETDHGA